MSLWFLLNTLQEKVMSVFRIYEANPHHQIPYSSVKVLRKVLALFSLSAPCC